MTAATKTKLQQICISKNEDYVDYMYDIGILDDDAEVVSVIRDPEEVKGKIIIGIAPPWILCHADSYILLDFKNGKLPRGVTWQDATFEELKKAGPVPRMYRAPVEIPIPARYKKRAQI